ncbi:hypothetical protein IAD21_06067 [Abditibacteriota bacterium]|nr:hypothetical protein IAD21_06067 [Abditibacteriota bacterium]
MEPELRDDKQIEREVCRVAVAFGVTEWETQKWGHIWMMKGIGEANAWVNYGVNALTGRWIGVRVGSNVGKECEVYEKAPTIWVCRPHPLFNELMVHGLYRLGFTDQAVLAELNYPLTTHEQIELRLSVPYQFWPPIWLEEAKQD